MTRIYVAVWGEPGGNEDDPVWTVGAYSTAELAKEGCEADAVQSRGEPVPPIQWIGDGTGQNYWTDAEPYGYRINAATLDAMAAELHCHACGAHISEPHNPGCTVEPGTEQEG